MWNTIENSVVFPLFLVKKWQHHSYEIRFSQAEIFEQFRFGHVNKPNSPSRKIQPKIQTISAKFWNFGKKFHISTEMFKIQSFGQEKKNPKGAGCQLWEKESRSERERKGERERVPSFVAVAIADTSTAAHCHHRCRRLLSPPFSPSLSLFTLSIFSFFRSSYRGFRAKFQKGSPFHLMSLTSDPRSPQLANPIKTINKPKGTTMVEYHFLGPHVEFSLIAQCRLKK